jgi:hypothetical protein
METPSKIANFLWENCNFCWIFSVDHYRDLRYNIRMFSKKESAMDIKAINTAIITSSFTNDQLSSIIDAVKYARSQLTKTKLRSFSVGDKVKFTSTKNGMTYVGEVEKVKLKFVLIKTPTSRWNVPANMLEAA